MKITFEKYERLYLEEMTQTWNEILEDGVAFPGEEFYSAADFEKMLAEQSAVTCMFYDGKYVGYFVMHPNNIGRCSHIGNASYCIDKSARGKGGFSALVAQSIKQAAHLGFSGLQFNAVVASNLAALHTYIKNGFSIIGTVPAGFRLKDGTLSDMHILYRAV